MSVRILLVEDNETNADILVRWLTRRGFAVSVATTGLHAITAARRDRPDLLVMDISLPEIDGWEAARRIKADATTARIPVIALTANAMVSDRERCFEVGCAAFETKPVDLDRLLDKMRHLVGPVYQA